MIGPLPAGRIERRASGAQCHPGFSCYSPQNMRIEVYDIPSGTGADGAGKRERSSSSRGVRQQDDRGRPRVVRRPVRVAGSRRRSRFCRNGTGRQDDPDVFSWIVETSIDVEWAHAIAPGANIVLCRRPKLTTPVQDQRRAPAGRRAVSRRDRVAELRLRRDVREARPDRRRHRGTGSTRLGGRPGVHRPRRRRRLILVRERQRGRSDRHSRRIRRRIPFRGPASGAPEGPPRPDDGLWSDGHYGGEQVWNETSPFQAATGGAPSQIFPSPPYQAWASVSRSARHQTSPTTSSVAAGFMTPRCPAAARCQRRDERGSAAVGVGIFAIANDGSGGGSRRSGPPLGGREPGALRHDHGSGRMRSDSHDITVGDNVFDPEIGGFSATLGYDSLSGIVHAECRQPLGLTSCRGRRGDSARRSRARRRLPERDAGRRLPRRHRAEGLLRARSRAPPFPRFRSPREQGRREPVHPGYDGPLGKLNLSQHERRAEQHLQQRGPFGSVRI